MNKLEKICYTLATLLLAVFAYISGVLLYLVGQPLGFVTSAIFPVGIANTITIIITYGLFLGILFLVLKSIWRSSGRKINNE